MSYLDVGERSVTIGDPATQEYLRRAGETMQDIWNRSRTPTAEERERAQATNDAVVDQYRQAGDPLVAIGDAAANFNPVEWFKRLVAVGLGASLIITGLIMSKPANVLQKVVK